MKLQWFVPLTVIVAACGTGGGGNEDGGGGVDASATDGDSSVTTPNDTGTTFPDVTFGDSPTTGGCSPDPGNFDVPGNNCDDDGDGTVDNAPACDANLPTTGTAVQFANAIGLCQMADATHWGIVSATYTQGYNNTNAPNANQHGIVPKFGSSVTPRQGSSLGVLSSGYASDYDSCSNNNGFTKFGKYTFKYGCAMTGGGTAPPGYPKSASGCPNNSVTNDVSSVVLQVKVPKNAQGFAYDFDFFSGEWPEWVCTNYNDSFVAWLTSAAFSGKSGDYNISFDSSGNPVSVNNNFFQACSPSNATVGCCSKLPLCNATGKTDACSLGNAQLQGTGFYIPYTDCPSQTDSGGGATGWLTTQAPAQAWETITLQFFVWDTGDQIYDSSVLVDNWQWQAVPTQVQTGRPPN